MRRRVDPLRRLRNSWSRPAAVAVFLLVGIGLLANPLYLWPHFHEYQYSVAAVEQVPSDTASDAETIAYESLPPEAMESFDATRAGEDSTFWSTADGEAKTALAEHRYIRDEGDYYRYEFRHGDRLWSIAGLLRDLLAGLGAVSIVVAGFIQGTGRWRPLTLRRCLAFPTAVVLGLIAVRAYDVSARGLNRDLFVFDDLAVFLPIAALFVLGGSIRKTHGRRRFLAFVGSFELLIVLGTLGFGFGLLGATLFGGGTAVVGLSFAALGYVLTPSSN